MITKIMKLAIWSTVMALLSTSAAGQETKAGSTDPNDNDEKLEEIVVLGRAISMQSASVTVEDEMVMDTSAVLKHLPGADVNINGRITGIAQYRGMYGDRVSVAADGLGMISGGPNAMDTPLSYVSPMITEDLELERGIPGVGSAPESVGGHIDVTLARGSFADSAEFGLAGMLGSRYSENGNSSTSAGRITVANDRHKLSVIAEADRADDLETPEGKIIPSRLSRNRADLSYAFAGKNSELLLFGGMLDTNDAGTPALAMDIRVIDTKIAGARVRTALTQNVVLDVNLGYNDVHHEMNNFSLRTAPASAMRYRMNTAKGSGTNFELSATTEMANSTIRIGVDGRLASHDSVISNPENSMFLIQNFTDIQRDLTGAFAVWKRSGDDSDWELGLRFNEIQTDAGTVSANGLMGMMGTAADSLSDDFNNADRKNRYRNIDAVVKYQRLVFGNAELHLEVGSKTRAPSYQELYLWLPLQATGGLADGRNYIGSLGLDSERSNEVNIGLGWSTGRFDFSPQVFFKSVNNYIQGVPSDNMTANMVSVMMSGATALEFANVEAEIYGFDLGWSYRSTENLYFDGLVAYARGKRTDVVDNLYRLAPPNASVAVNYVASNWTTKTEIVGYSRQDNVSAFNDEQATAGYAILNLSAVWNPWQTVRLEARADNLFDRSYQNHLAGVNRAMGSDIPVGTRLYGAGRTLSAGLVITF